MKTLQHLSISLFLIFSSSALTAQNTTMENWANFQKYAARNAQLEKPTKKENRVVLMGNSITEVWANTRSSFFENNSLVGRGISGQTTPQMLLRFRADVIELEPKAVVILAGINDIAENTGSITIDQIMDNIQSMAEMAAANDIAVVLSSVLPAYDFPWRPGLEPAPKVMELNGLIKSYCKEKGHVYLDYFSEMADDRNGLSSDLSPDEVHPNEKGYGIMEPLAIEAIQKALSMK